MSFLGVVKHRESRCQKSPPKTTKSITLGASGRILRFWSVLGKGDFWMIFDDFEIFPRNLKNLKNKICGDVWDHPRVPEPRPRRVSPLGQVSLSPLRRISPRPHFFKSSLPFASLCTFIVNFWSTQFWEHFGACFFIKCYVCFKMLVPIWAQFWDSFCIIFHVFFWYRICIDFQLILKPCCMAITKFST